MQNKKIVLLAGEGFSTRVLYNNLKKEFQIEKVILEDSISRLQFLKRRAQKLGVTRVIGQILFQAGVVPFLKKRSQGRIREITSQFRLDDTEIDSSKIIKVNSVNSSETAGVLKDMNPKLVVVSGTRIITEKILQCTSARFVNMHTGVTPQYRGVHGGYWSLVQGDKSACGVTVHLVDSGIDTGSILGQSIISPEYRDDFVTYPLLQLAAGLPVMRNAVKNLLDDTVEIQPALRDKSKLWSHPTIWEYFFYLATRGVR